MNEANAERILIASRMVIKQIECLQDEVCNIDDEDESREYTKSIAELLSILFGDFLFRISSKYPQFSGLASLDHEIESQND